MTRLLAACALAAALVTLPPVPVEAHTGSSYPWMWTGCRGLPPFREYHRVTNVSTGATKYHYVWSLHGCLVAWRDGIPRF